MQTPHRRVDLGQLHEGEDALLHASAARRGHQHVRGAGRCSLLQAAGEALAGDDGECSPDELEVEGGEPDRFVRERARAGAQGFVEAILKKTPAAATSSAVPSRLIGVSFTSSPTISSVNEPLVSSVRTYPGATALHVMLREPYSRATDLVNPMSPALAAA